MGRVFFLVISVFLAGPTLRADACEEALREVEAPVKMETDGKPKRAKWSGVDKVLNQVAQQVEGQRCSLTFSQLFRTDRQELFFPLTNTVLRVAPEEQLKGLEVFDSAGERLGKFASRVSYERTGGLYARRSYTLHYFQFEDDGGRLQSTGKELLLDRFLVRWEELKDFVALSTGSR